MFPTDKLSPADAAILETFVVPRYLSLFGELAQQTRRCRSRALVLSMQSLHDARTQMRVLLEVAGCPVVLVR